MLNHNCSSKVEGETLASHITVIEDAAASLHPPAIFVFLVVCSMYACVSFRVNRVQMQEHIADDYCNCWLFGVGHSSINVDGVLTGICIPV